MKTFKAYTRDTATGVGFKIIRNETFTVTSPSLEEATAAMEEHCADYYDDDEEDCEIVLTKIEEV